MTRAATWKLLACLMFVSTADCARSAGCDVSTEKGALAVYKKLTGRNGSPGCIDIYREFPGLAYVGEVAPDAGCLGTIMIWQCRKADDADLPAILHAAGWQSGDEARLKIAREWLGVREWLGGDVLWDDTSDARQTFAEAGRIFSPPMMATENGGVHVEGWLVETGITIAGLWRKYARFTADFAADGRVARSVGAEEFEPGRRQP